MIARLTIAGGPTASKLVSSTYTVSVMSLTTLAASSGHRIKRTLSSIVSQQLSHGLLSWWRRRPHPPHGAGLYAAMLNRSTTSGTRIAALETTASHGHPLKCLDQIKEHADMLQVPRSFSKFCPRDLLPRRNGRSFLRPGIKSMACRSGPAIAE